jgi:hypothetical protein
MIELKLMVWDKAGKEHVLNDYLLEAMGHKLRHFCSTHNMLDKYESGTLWPADCYNKQGSLDLIVQAGKPNPKGGIYPDRNSVKDYIVIEGQPIAPVKDKDFDQDLPF